MRAGVSQSVRASGARRRSTLRGFLPSPVNRPSSASASSRQPTESITPSFASAAAWYSRPSSTGSSRSGESARPFAIVLTNSAWRWFNMCWITVESAGGVESAL